MLRLIDQGENFKPAFSIFLGLKLRLLSSVGSRDVFTSLSKQWNSLDKSIGANVNVICSEYEPDNADEVIWIAVPMKLTDSRRKSDSPLTKPLKPTISNGKILTDLLLLELRSADHPLP